MSATHTLRIAIRNRMYGDSEGLAIVGALPSDTTGLIAELAGDFAAMCLHDPLLDRIAQLDELPAEVIARALTSPHLPRDELLGQFVIAMTAHDRRAGWKRAFEVIRKLARRPPKNASLRRAVGEISADSSVVAAIATAAASAPALDPFTFGAVLAAVGTPDAARALAAHLRSQDYDLDMALEHSANTPAMAALADERARCLAELREASPGVQLLRMLQLPGDTIHVVVSFEAPEHDTAILVHIQTCDAHRTGTFTVSCHQDSTKTSFDETTLSCDELEIGRCNVLELPAWVASVGERLGMTWTMRVIKLTPAGPTRTAVKRWLASYSSRKP